MLYGRIDLAKTNYTSSIPWAKAINPDIKSLNILYQTYCRHKQFKSVMPIFDSEYVNNDVILYYDENQFEYIHTLIVGFSIIKAYDSENAECIQFAWDYKNPALRLGIKSLENECAIYKALGFKYLYLGDAAEYKKQIQGFEILGPI